MELYVHIPFCVRKCEYCDFLSAPADERLQNRYVGALLHEIRYYGQTMGRPDLSTLESIKFRPFSWEAEHRLF